VIGGGVGARGAVGRVVGVYVAVGGKAAVGVLEGISVEVLVETGVSVFWGEGVAARSTWCGKQEVRRLARASSSSHRFRNFNLFIFAPVQREDP
jgi:hypothetical protein